jgi:succinate dehydrogenase/fumarate reductase flavoprotein subunit
MTTGGFGANEQLKKTFLHSPIMYAGTSFAQGDGLIMTQKIGAAFWHTYGVCGQVGFKAPELEQPFQPRATDEAFIWVDKHGRRYTNETQEKLHNAWRNCSLFDPEAMEYPRIPVYQIFDDVMMKKAPISRDWRPRGDHEWSLDNSEELARGWITKGETIGELARKLNMEESVLEETIEKFNACCRNGVDPEYGRAPETMKPIDKPAYYALKLEPMAISTGGGPAHDKQSRAVDYAGNPIPRLYVAGELSSVIGWLYEAGTGHAECIVFGKIAGLNAAKETPLAE